MEYLLPGLWGQSVRVQICDFGGLTEPFEVSDSSSVCGPISGPTSRNREIKSENIYKGLTQMNPLLFLRPLRTALSVTEFVPTQDTSLAATLFKHVPAGLSLGTGRTGFMKLLLLPLVLLLGRNSWPSLPASRGWRGRGIQTM